MFKSYRDIKSSLDVSRKRKGVSRTAQIESKIVKEIESKYGNLRNNACSEDLALRERARKQKQIQSLEQSRLRLFINKGRRSRLQEERLNPFLDDQQPSQSKDNVPNKTSNPVDQFSKLRRMELKY
jgi:hypothetical protein